MADVAGLTDQQSEARALAPAGGVQLVHQEPQPVGRTDQVLAHPEGPQFG
jgi:hypothetical protein